MRLKVIAHLHMLFQMLQEIAELLPEAAFVKSLSEPSNTIGQQFWCVIGARESYTSGIINNGWVGFSCSLSYEQTREKQIVLESLVNSARSCIDAIEDIEWTAERDQLLLDLLEHEVQHQGQFIRYVYGLGYRFPDSWAQRWALEQ